MTNQEKTTNISILGTNYRLSMVDEYNEEIEHKGGVTKFREKEIFVWQQEDDLEDTKRVLMHEFMHAFFYEAGLVDYASDEILTDFIAVQMPKLVKLYEKAQSLENKEND